MLERGRGKGAEHLAKGFHLLVSGGYRIVAVHRCGQARPQLCRSPEHAARLEYSSGVGLSLTVIGTRSLPYLHSLAQVPRPRLRVFSWEMHHRWTWTKFLDLNSFSPFAFACEAGRSPFPVKPPD